MPALMARLANASPEQRTQAGGDQARLAVEGSSPPCSTTPAPQTLSRTAATSLASTLSSVAPPAPQGVGAPGSAGAAG